MDRLPVASPILKACLDEFLTYHAQNGSVSTPTIPLPVLCFYFIPARDLFFIPDFYCHLCPLLCLIALNASIVAYGRPVSGSRYFAGSPVTTQTLLFAGSGASLGWTQAGKCCMLHISRVVLAKEQRIYEEHKKLRIHESHRTSNRHYSQSTGRPTGGFSDHSSRCRTQWYIRISWIIAVAVHKHHNTYC